MEKHFADIVNIEFTAGIEEELDKVEETGTDWREIIRDFYGPFEHMLSAAEQSIEKVVVADQVSDIPCEKCGAMMVYKAGRFGKFLACPNFPECRCTMPLLIYIEDVACPDCGGRLLERISRKGRKFFGCEHYPECAFVSWDRPVADKCPDCNGRMVFKRTAKGEVYNVCVNEQCRCRVLVKSEEDGDTPDMADA
jgi:DNA topoisomerase-1